KELERMLGVADADLAASAAEKGDWKPVRAARNRLFETIQRNATRGKKLNVIGYWLSDLNRRRKRIVRPTGMWITFLGDKKTPETQMVAKWVEPLDPQAFRGIKSMPEVRNYFRQVLRYKLRSQLVTECATRRDAMSRWRR